MSRVDQAMKRAARDRLKSAGADDFVGVLAEDLESFVEEDGSLDLYPAEQSGRPKPAAAPPMAAPMPVVAPAPPARPRVVAESPKAVPDDSAGPTRPAAAARNRWQEQPDKIPLRDHEFGTDMDGKLVVLPDVPADFIDQFGRAADALVQAQAERGVKVVMVSSALPQEGRSLTAINLALALSERGKKRVLLVDADLANPSLDRLLSLPNVRGLSDALVSRHATVSPAKVRPTLSVLTAGSPVETPLELLISNVMRDFLKEASARFDWVVLDSPPGSEMPDAHLLAWLADGVMLVVKSGKTPRKVLRKMLDELGVDRVLGIVLNRVKGSGAKSAAVPRSTRAASSRKTLFGDE